MRFGPVFKKLRKLDPGDPDFDKKFEKLSSDESNFDKSCNEHFISTGFHFPPQHPLLALAERKKFPPHSAKIAMNWIATSSVINPDWPHRANLSRLTGFDFNSPNGCTAARRFVEEKLGKEAIKRLDEAILGRRVPSDPSALAPLLERLWTVWCEHGRTTLDIASESC
jgi:hypothetical protein